MALWDPQRQEGALHLAKLPNAAPDKDYQLWIITPESKQPLDAGVIPPSTQGLAFRAAQPVGQVAALAISLEPKGGSARSFIWASCNPRLGTVERRTQGVTSKIADTRRAGRREVRRRRQLSREPARHLG